MARYMTSYRGVTDKQRRMLSLIRACREKYSRVPPYVEIGSACGICSISAVKRGLGDLRRRGLVHWEDRKPETLRLTEGMGRVFANAELACDEAEAAGKDWHRAWNKAYFKGLAEVEARYRADVRARARADAETDAWCRARFMAEYRAEAMPDPEGEPPVPLTGGVADVVLDYVAELGYRARRMGGAEALAVRRVVEELTAILGRRDSGGAITISIEGGVRR